ncbi:MAG TPA: TfoX/Sxy family protein, partial [Thermomicrobiales bacterium]|nr:TfoX/Sxy family protein [Thermomicrobiales bacterium]
MAFDQGLVERIRDVLADEPAISGRKVFGSFGFFVSGNMFSGVTGERLLIRTGPEAYEATLLKPYVQPFPPEGKPMRNWASVDPEAVAEDA